MAARVHSHGVGVAVVASLASLRSTRRDSRHIKSRWGPRGRRQAWRGVPSVKLVTHASRPDGRRPPCRQGSCRSSPASSSHSHAPELAASAQPTPIQKASTSYEFSSAVYRYRPLGSIAMPKRVKTRIAVARRCAGNERVRHSRPDRESRHASRDFYHGSS